MGQKVDRMEAQMVDRSVDQMVVRTEALKAGLRGGRLEDRLEDRSVGQMVVRTEALKAGRLEGHSVNQMAVQTADRSAGLMEAHLAGLQDLSEVRVALHRFAQLVPVQVQARLPFLRVLVVLGLEVVFA